MERNRIFDIMINLLEGIKNQNKLVEKCNDKEMVLNNCSYLLNQTIRQYQVPQSHYFVSEKAQALWSQISTDSIFNYTYRDQVTKKVDGAITIEKFRGGEGTPYATTMISRGDRFTYKDVFTDEHIVTVSNIIDEILALKEYNYASIERILNKIYICKMLKCEDRSITNKKDRSTDYREVIVYDYRDAGIILTTFDYKANLEQLILEKREELAELELEEELLTEKADIDSGEEKIIVKDNMSNKKEDSFKVVHDQKGEGKVIGRFVDKNGDQQIRIDFGNNVEDFAYPDQFMCHLKAKDPERQKQIEKEFAERQNKSASVVGNCFLEAGKFVGSNAQDIYKQYCRIFGWNLGLHGKFAKQKKLYALNATPEGYSVWMIVHNNWVENYNRIHDWFNFVGGDWIREVWFARGNQALLDDKSTRVCFAKTKIGSQYQYQFLGIYVPEKIQYEMIEGRSELVRTFRRISKTYPNKIQTQPQPKSFLIPEIEPDRYVETTLVVDGCKIEAYKFNENKTVLVYVDKLPSNYQKKLIGMRVGETYSLFGKTYRIDKVFIKA